MSAAFIILTLLVVIALLWYFYKKKEEDHVVVAGASKVYKSAAPSFTEAGMRTSITTRTYLRKTYVSGTLTGKFHGSIDAAKEREGYERERYFDIAIYEAKVTNATYRSHQDGPPIEQMLAEEFSGKLPDPLPCLIYHEGRTRPFQISLHGARLYKIDFDKYRALHQEEDDEVFGTVESQVTGYIQEVYTEQSEEQIFIPATQPEPVVPSTPVLEKTGVPTGKTKRRGNYLSTEYWYSNHRDTYWEQKYDPLPIKDPGGKIGFDTDGCWSAFGYLILALLALAFLAAIGPVGIGVLVAVLLLGLLIRFAGLVLVWVVRAIAAVLIVTALVQLFNRDTYQQTLPIPQHDPAEVTTTRTEPVTDGKSPTIPDSFIVHHRIWQDYEGRRYQGNIAIRIKDVHHSMAFKNALQPIGRTSDEAYNNMLAQLYKADKDKLNGVYPLLDSIRDKTGVSDDQFANIIVSFVQDIPYSLVLAGPCNSSQAPDAFTRQYLQSNPNACDDYQPFGINSPAEFFAGLKGDCDTRTLALYTIFAHYGYGVAILSSNYYAHSILAVDLPLQGKTVLIQNRPYSLWETTATGIPAGFIPESIADLSKWSISLLHPRSLTTLNQ